MAGPKQGLGDEPVPGLGTVVVKVDRAGGSDWDWDLDDGEQREDSGGHQIRGVYCCDDTSDLCDKSDMLTVDGCRSRFSESSAYDSGCRLQMTTSAVEVTGEDCYLNAICPYRLDDSSPVRERGTTITVHFLDVDDLDNCDGVLTEGSVLAAADEW